MTSLFGVPVDGAYHLVLGLTTVLTPVLGGLAAVAGIVVFTMAIRLLLMPLSFRALRGQAAMSRLAPRIQELRQRYGRQPERLQRELTALYAREGTSLLGGFVPLLAQWPVFSVLYLLFRSSSVAGGPNKLLSSDLFGVPLGDHWLSGSGVLSAQGAVFFGVLAVLAVVCWLSVLVARRMTAAISAATAAAAGPTAARRGSARGSAAAKSAAAAPGTGRAASLLGMVLPFLTVVIAAFAPLAAAVYLVVSTGWSVGERWVFSRARHREAAGQDGQGGRQSGGRQTSGDRPLAGNTLGGRAHRP
jgi:YidC/Oxa1 family membrane protein insertase